MTKTKTKKYRVIVDFYEAREESARDQIQFYRDEYDEELSEETADQWNNAEDHPDLENYHPLSIEDFIDALEAVEDDGGIDEVRATASFYISDQAVRILLSTYGLLWGSGIDLDEVKSVIYD